MRDFKNIKVTRKIEKKRGWKKGLYDYTSVESNSLKYRFSDSIGVKYFMWGNQSLEKNL